MRPTEGPRPFSISQWRTYQRCAAQYRFGYIEGGASAANTLMIRGRGVDSAASHNYRQKAMSHHDLPVRDVMDVAATAVDEAFHGRVILTRDERGIGHRNVQGAVLDEAVRMARVYHMHLAPSVQPALDKEGKPAVQERLLVTPAANILSRPLVGIVDVRTADGGILDVKAKKAALREGDEHSDLQLTAYAALAHAVHGKMPAYVGFDIVHGGRGKRIGSERRTSTRTREDFIALADNFRATVGAIEAGSFPPTGMNTWACSEENCTFWEECPFVRGVRSRR